MPDFEVTLSRVLPEGQGAFVKSVVLQDIQRGPAIVMGMDEVFKWAAEENDPNIPEAAVTYWQDCRRNGNLQLYEIQSELDSRWGISTIIKEVSPPVDVTPRQPRPRVPHHNGTGSSPSSLPSDLPDLRTMLTQRYALLQNREKQLIAERDRICEEYERTREDLRETEQMLMTLRPARKKKPVPKPVEPVLEVVKKRGRPKKEPANAAVS